MRARRRPTKTPMFTARNSARYERQDSDPGHQHGTENTELICYVGGVDTQITQRRPPGVRRYAAQHRSLGDPVDLMLHTCGGDVDACEKLVAVLHAKVGGPVRCA